MKKRGILIIISGPSGSGKGTIVKELIQDENYYLSISLTTRGARMGEEDGIHYFFRSTEEFLELRENNELLEWAEFCGNFYATPKKNVEQKLEEGKNVILEIEVQGAFKVKELYPDSVFIFVVPPSIEELRKRLVNRGTEKHSVIDERIARALEEIKLMDQYDYIVVNDALLTAVNNINTIVRAEQLKSKRNLYLTKQIIGADC
jgi:guanylate kinase